MRKHLLTTLTSLYLLAISTYSLAQTNKSWAQKYEHQKVFIENKGQFSIPTHADNNEEVLYAVNHGGTKIYFTKKGIIYTFLETTKKQKDAREIAHEIARENKEKLYSPEEYQKHEKEERALKIKTDDVTMLFQNASDNVELEASDETPDYQNYSVVQANGILNNISNIRSFTKLTYKNVYPNIDIDYTFSEKGGLKYIVILHAGADATQLKMVYDNHISLSNTGEIHINTKFGDMIDHAPLTFYQQNKSSIINSKFIKTGKIVSFQLDSYDNSKTVIIDPWVQTPAYTSNWDCVWECERDGAGNVYTFGGVTPVQIKKYNSAGVIQWTYNTPYDTSSWIGTFAVDNVGNAYVTNGTAAGIIKLNTAGILQWTVSGGSLVEYWNIAFNCDQTKLIVGGTDNLRGAIFDINTSNGAVTATKIVAYGSAFGFPPSIQEVRSITSCGNGRYYFLTLDSIGYINQNLTLCGANPAIFKTTSTHGFSYKCENYRYDNTGIMAIRADLNFVYTHNGTTLFKRSLANAAILASVAIPGGAATTSLGQKAVSCSGIDIDASGNIYVGSTNAVTKFSPALVQLGTVAVPFNVYDVHVSTAGDVIACGSTGNSGTATRTGYIQSIASLTAANSLSLTCCDINICPVTNICSTAAAITLQPATAGGTWSGTGITNAATGVFNPAIAGAGAFVITYSLACGVGTTTITVITCGTMSVCNNAGTLNVTGGTGPYSWASTSTSISCASCPGGSCIPFVCAGTSVPTWTASGSSVTAPSAGTFPITLTDAASGTTVTLTTLSGIASCSVSSCPTLTLSVASQTNVNCYGASTGSATINSIGGTGPYTYTWSPSGGNSSSANSLIAGVYTVSVKDANLCPGTLTVTITQPTASLTANITGTTQATCGQANASATVTASGGTTAYTYSWIPSGGTAITTNSLGAGSVSVIVTDAKGCTKTALTTITSASGPTLSVVSQTNVNCFGASTGSATVNSIGGTGPYTYTWNPGNLNGATQTNLAAGIYTIVNTDAGGCSGSGTVTITQPTASLTANITATTQATCGQTNASAAVTASGGTTAYTYSWVPSGGTAITTNSLGAGSVSVIVKDAKGCAKTAITTITSASGPTLSVVSQTNVNCFGASTGSATVNSIGGTGPYTYTWNPGNLNGATQTNLAAGIYTIVNADASGCSGSGTVAITQPTASLTGVTTTSNTTCGGSTGSATVTASGGTLGYTYNWSPSGGSSNIATGLTAQNYVVTITDAKNCTVTASALINSIGGPTVSITSQSNIPCSGGNVGSATVSAVGGSGTYTYTWSPSGGNASSASNLGAGMYTVAVSSGGCIGTTIVTITQAPTLTLNLSSTSATCTAFNGSASVIATGGSSVYTYTWSNSSNTSSISALAGGIYTVNVNDGAGCIKTGTVAVAVSTITFVIDAGNYTTIPTGGSAALNGTVPVGSTYTWSPSNTLSCSNCLNPIATPAQSTTYTLSVTNTNGCQMNDTVTVHIDLPCGELFVPTAFSPNNDGSNDVLYVYGNCISDLTFVLFNRWGEKVFETTDPTVGWDGTFNGKPENPAAFAYYIKAKVDGISITKNGSIALVK